MNYLRCLIAKISSSTHISPAGYYKFGGSDNEDTDFKSYLQSNDPSIVRNLSYEPVNEKKLLDTKNWVHHQPNILENGKANWILSKSLEKKYEQATDDENDEFEKSTPENSFKLLSFCCEDTTSENIQPWTSKLTCVNDSRNYLVHMRSNLWPGAFAFAYER